MRNAIRGGLIVLTCLMIGRAGEAQAVEGHFSSDGKSAAVKTCWTFARGSGPEMRVASWSVFSPDQRELYFDQFVTYADGARVQIESTKYNASREFETLLFDPAMPKRRFIRVKARPAGDETECKGDLVAEISTANGRFSSCLADASTKSVSANEAFLLTQDDPEWLRVLARTYVTYAYDRQLTSANIAFLQPIFDSRRSIRPATAHVFASPCDYRDIRDEVSANFQPRAGIEAAYQKAVKK